MYISSTVTTVFAVSALSAVITNTSVLTISGYEGGASGMTGFGLNGIFEEGPGIFADRRINIWSQSEL